MSANNTIGPLQPCHCVTEGSIYISISIFGIIENILTAILIATDTELRSPTYYYMVNLCLADVVELLAIGLYQGLILIDSQIAIGSISTPPILMFLRGVGVFECAIFMLAICLNRFLTLKKAQVEEPRTDTKRLLAKILAIWLIFPVAFGALLFSGTVPLIFDYNHFVWAYDSSKTVGRVAVYAFPAYAVLSMAAVAVLNAVSLYFVRKVRKKIQSFSSELNVKAEIKLFIQCAVTTSITFFVVIVYCTILAFQNRLPAVLTTIAHTSWLISHVHSPMIYCFMNARLRRRLFSVLRCRFKSSQVLDVRVRVDKVHSLVLA